MYHQMVVPHSCRSEILSVAHKAPLGGHHSVNKPYHKMSVHFYRPNIEGDMVQFWQSCHTCQILGKLSQNIEKPKLQAIPAFKEACSRVLTDCVGPLLKKKKKKKNLFWE